ncbi:DUF2190 family protein [Ruegeria sp. Ofav3-42]|uniref:DUF2190 family protein n=1 Tax=Ruegeria sp. Ofav3-42 TaxID=2917759 RepID=UPI001EF5CB00|nr:DUF2190 family protein [Ruegeria sp. Ofav3-42]MCG7520852.1 DUF2190 family protein [Ruegeria sp. Ofav3-42]
MKNMIQTGTVITVLAAADVVSGAGVKIGMLFGVAQADAKAGEVVSLVTEGVFDLPKTSAQAWSVGDPIYFNNSTKLCTTATTAGNIHIGTAVAEAGNPSGSGLVRLNGAMPAAAV